MDISYSAIIEMLIHCWNGKDIQKRCILQNYSADTSPHAQPLLTVHDILRVVTLFILRSGRQLSNSKITCDEEYFPIEMILYKYFLKENIIHKWFIFHQSSIKSSSYKSIANILFLWVPCHDSPAEKKLLQL